jgi:hypothetical protein
MASQKIQLSATLHCVSAFCGILLSRRLVKPKLQRRLKLRRRLTCQAVALAKADRHCVPTSVGARSSGFARLELGAFYFAISSMSFYVFIKENDTNTGHIQVPGTGKTGGV